MYVVTRSYITTSNNCLAGYGLWFAFYSWGLDVHKSRIQGYLSVWRNRASMRFFITNSSIENNFRSTCQILSCFNLPTLTFCINSQDSCQNGGITENIFCNAFYCNMFYTQLQMLSRIHTSDSWYCTMFSWRPSFPQFRAMVSFL